MAHKSPAEWAIINVQEYERCLDKWERSLSHSRPDYNALLGAYKHLYGAEINFLDAKDKTQARRAATLRKRMAKTIEKIMACCGPMQAISIWHSRS